MNKLLQKVAKLTLGLAMAAGVGVAIGAGHKDASQARAATSFGTATIDFGNEDTDWAPSSSGSTKTDSLGQTWTCTYTTSSTTPNADYYQLGSNNKALSALSLTASNFTQDVKLTAFSFTGHAGSNKTVITFQCQVDGTTNLGTGGSLNKPSGGAGTAATASFSGEQTISSGHHINVSFNPTGAGFRLVSLTYTIASTSGGGHTHVWDSGTITTQPTCTEAGVKTYSCTVSGCSETTTEAVDPLGHSYGEWTVDTAASCTEDGSRHHICSRCSDREDETIPATGHNYVDHVCTICGANEPLEVTFAYSGSTTNMSGGNDAATLGQSDTDWSLVANKGGNSNYPGLNTDGSIRLYGSDQNYIVIKTLASSGTRYLTSVVIASSQPNFDVFEGEADFTSEISTLSESSPFTYTLGEGVTAFTIRNNSSTQSRIQSITVSYEESSSASKTLESISVSQNHRTFTVNDAFVKETVTANYSDGSDADVTNDATFSGYNMANTGNQTVTVSYEDEYGSASTSYSITVNARVPLLSLDVSEINGYTGQSISITATYANLESDLAWSASGTGIISGGSITWSSADHRNGTSTYSCTLTGEGGKTIVADADGVEAAQCGITITKTTVDITKSSTSIAQGKSETLAASHNASSVGGLNWTSTNDSVATVDSDGKVTVAAGATVGTTVTITATSSVDTGVSDICTVTVTAAPIDTTYDFVTNFSSYNTGWTNSYGDHTGISGKTQVGGGYTATIDLYYASKQGSTITDRPVFATKTSSGNWTKVIGFTLTESDYKIGDVSVTFSQWTTKTPDIALFSGDEATGTPLDSGTVGTKNTISTTGLNAKVFTVGYCDKDTGNVQAGLTSIYITLVKENKLDHVTVSFASDPADRTFYAGSNFAFNGTLTASYTVDAAKAVTPTGYFLEGEEGTGDEITTSTILTVADYNGGDVYVQYVEGGITKYDTFTLVVNPAPATSVTLSSSSGSVGLSETFRVTNINATVQPSAYATQGVTWEVYDSDGLVEDSTYMFDGTDFYATEPADVVFHVKANSNESIYATFTLTITGNPTATFDKESTSGYVGKTEVIGFTYGNMNDVSKIDVVSSNTSYVSVEDDLIADDGVGLVTINFVAAGSADIRISYDGGSTLDTLSVTVNADSVSSISVKNNPTKTIYTVGETFSAEGLVISATMASSDTVDLTSNQYNLKNAPTVLNDRGVQTITVELVADTSITTSFNITVNMPSGLKIVTKTSNHDGGYIASLLTSANTLTSGMKVAIGCANRQDIMAAYPGTGNNIKTLGLNDENISVSYNGTNKQFTFSGTGADAAIYTLSSDESGWILTDINGNRLYKPSGNNNYLKADTTSAGYHWSISLDENGVATISNTQYSSKGLLSRNNGASDNLYSCYASNSANIESIELYSVSEGESTYSYDAIDLSGTIYDFIRAVYNNSEYYTCSSGGTDSSLSNWSNITSNAKYIALTSTDKENLANAVLSSPDGTKNSSEMVADFLTQYDYVVWKYGKSYDYLGRVNAGTATVRQSINIMSVLMGENTNTVGIIVIISMVSVTAIGGYFFLRKRKENN